MASCVGNGGYDILRDWNGGYCHAGYNSEDAEKYKAFAAASGLKKSLNPEFIGLSLDDM